LYIVSISIYKRKKEVPEVQSILTKYGEEIHARIGLHNISKDKKGLIIVAYTGKNIEDFIQELKSKENVIINYMKTN